MKLIPGRRLRFQQGREAMMLDDAEMALELTDLARTTRLKDAPEVSGSLLPTAELLTELYSAASMIMDRAECEAVVREFEQAVQTPTPRPTRIVAA